MPTTFAYKVRDRGGKVIEGTLEADTQAAVVGRLREMGYAPLLVQEQRAGLGAREIRLPWKRGVKAKDLAVMSRQFATMINSGLSLLRALNILSEQRVREQHADGYDLLKVFGLSPEAGKNLSNFFSTWFTIIVDQNYEKRIRLRSGHHNYLCCTGLWGGWLFCIAISQ